ncbi:MAG: hypothetical protein GF418_06400 [Chitinivibrionales bacterium]|nr:hypothetical protein [Chitinivibrionales bacterium]MBD3395240.1 hypothetical protein [Chitinivibrionales bacterium]
MSQGGHEEILRYLDRHGVVDKDRAASPARGKRPGRAKKTRARHRLEIDLHGKTEDAAEAALLAALAQCDRDGFQELVVIHGKGLHSPGRDAALKRLVRGMLEGKLRGSVKSYRPARPREGGDGATVVYVR